MAMRPTTTVPSPDLPLLKRGVLIRMDAAADSGEAGQGGGASNDAETNKALVFQYNPDMVTRTRTGRWESRDARNSYDTPQAVRARGGAGASHLMADSETVSIKVVFDATERILAGDGQDGVLAELAFLETASLGRTQERRRRSRSEGTPARSVKPDELLLMLGARRFPVVMTGLTVVEQKFAPDLTPIRAEADMRFTVLEPAEVAHNGWVAEAFEAMVTARITVSDEIAVTGTVDAILANAVGGNPDPTSDEPDIITSA